jgi:hypothetical protein
MHCAAMRVLRLKSLENILFSIFASQLLLPMSSGDDQEVKIGVIHCFECVFNVYIDLRAIHAEFQYSAPSFNMCNFCLIRQKCQIVVVTRFAGQPNPQHKVCSSSYSPYYILQHSTHLTMPHTLIMPYTAHQ